jgi:hypothetical protein
MLAPAIASIDRPSGQIIVLSDSEVLTRLVAD